jgi:hypothetical protein
VSAGAARFVVRAAAALLPARIRDRYREQWLADVRDAKEAGLTTSSIALGAVSFAATVARPAASFDGVRGGDVTRRSRGAIALGLSAALLAESSYATIAGVSGGLTGVTAYDLTVNIMTGLLALYGVAAPIAAVIVVIVTRGMPWRSRFAVLFFAAACLAPLASLSINSALSLSTTDSIENPFASAGALAYLAAAALIIAGCALVVRVPRGRSVPAATGAAVLVAFATGLGLVSAVFAWNGRPFATYQMPIDDPMYGEWLRNRQWFEQQVFTVFVGWAAIGVALVVAVLAVGLLANTRTTRALTIGTIGAIAIATAGAWNYLEIVGGGTYSSVFIEVCRVGGQVVLVSVVLAAVGALRYEKRGLPRVGHRHDVEGSVELL